MGSRTLTGRGSSGLRAVITGAAQGIGRATCELLAQSSWKWYDAPADIVAIDLSESHLEELRAVLSDAGARTHPIVGDVTDSSLPSRAISSALEKLGGIDCLVSNAGFARHAPLVDLELDQWDAVFHANVRAPWLFAREAYASLQQAGGSIVIVGSISGINPQVGLGAYSPSKAAAIMLARMLAVEWAGSGVRVNAVSPGPTYTATTGRFYSNEDILRERLEKMPVGKIGRAEDIAEAIAFLVSPDASYVNGENMIIDGALSTAAMLEFARLSGPMAAKALEEGASQ